MNDSEYARKHVHYHTAEVPQLLLEALAGAEWGSFMDLGCGDGALLAALLRAGLLAGKTVWAVDHSPERMEHVRRISPDFRCVVNSACELPDVPDHAVDLLAATQVIEHVPSDADMIRQIVRVVRPGGTVFLSTVFKKWYGWYYYRNQGRWVMDPTHVREYRRADDLLGILRRHGCQVTADAKHLFRMPVVEFLARRLHAGRDVFARSRLLRLLRAVRLPIPGYYNWQIVFRTPQPPAAPPGSSPTPPTPPGGPPPPPPPPAPRNPKSRKWP